MTKEKETLADKIWSIQKFEKINWKKRTKILFEKDVKDFIKKGDKIFCEDYGSDVTYDEYAYAQKKWEKFKKLAGEGLTK